MAKGLEEDDGDAVGEVEGSRGGIRHRDVDPALGMLLEKGQRKTGRFAAKHEAIAGSEGSLMVTAGRGLFDKPQPASLGQASPE